MSVSRLTKAAVSAISVLLLAACSGYAGTWPKLGPTATDAQQTMLASDDAATAPIPAAVQSPASGLSEEQAALATVLAQADAAFNDLETKLTSQSRAVRAAVSRVNQMSDANWSLAQLELSRLSQTESEIETIKSDVTSIAGDVAILEAERGGAGLLLERTGALLTRINDALQMAMETRVEARSRLTS